MKKSERIELEKKVLALKSKRKNRTIGAAEILKMAELDRKKSLNGKLIRIYSYDGFVPNSYNKGFGTKIDYIERTVNPETGIKKFIVGQGSANRSRGNGATITVNGRAFN